MRYRTNTLRASGYVLHGISVAQVPMKSNRVREKSGGILSAGLWATLAFVLNLVWEIAHIRLYTIWFEADRLSAARAVLHCSFGDVAIALAMFTIAGLQLHRMDWPASQPWAGGITVMIGALTFTVWSEWFNVFRIGNWSYASNMPTVFGIGISPLLQWLVLPPVIVIAYRALWPYVFSRSNDNSPDR